MLRRLACALLLTLPLSGCGDDGPTYVPVTGTVKYSDGTVPKGVIASINFQPVNPGADTKAASGSIASDGSFILTTIQPGDGARPGEYIVTVRVVDGYPDGKLLVAERFASPATSPLKETVEEGGDNKFDFVVARP